jgi:hypothetical protein
MLPAHLRREAVNVNHTPVSFRVTASDRDEERLAIEIRGTPAGEAVIRYGSGTATVDARVQLSEFPQVIMALDRFHHEFAAELLAYVLDRGAMAQESDGSIIYDLGSALHAVPLPANHEVGLGYPNSW